MLQNRRIPRFRTRLVTIVQGGSRRPLHERKVRGASPSRPLMRAIVMKEGGDAPPFGKGRLGGIFSVNEKEYR